MTKKVAVIGYSYRFPSKAGTSHWESLISGVDLVTEVDASRWEKAHFHHPDKNHPGSSHTFAAGSIGDISQFDADFFNISPREAALMDPQQRLLLEMSWEALENAGVKASSVRGSDCGVFIGIASADYFYRLMDDLAAVDASVATGNTSSIAANRLSYFFDLRGPSIAIDTACSSSLIAFHQACQSILSGESIQALTGGVSLHIHPAGFITFSKASMLSTSGHCNVFDANGDGYVRAEGGGVFFLKDYDQAIADGNRILAVVAGTASNTDGHKSGLTVPSATAQEALLTKVYAKAGIRADDISYIEAHGTGTAVGDPIETRALGAALGVKRARGKPLLIGSVKSNLGHLEAASGVAGLVKSLMSIQHRKVPQTIGVKTLNPSIKFDDWNLAVAVKNTELPKTGKLIIGTNSFGFGGANAHVILESYDSPESKAPRLANIPNVPLVISAQTESGLLVQAAATADFIRTNTHIAIYDVAYSSCFSRDWHSHRALVFGNTAGQIAAQFANFSTDAEATNVVQSQAVVNAKGPAFIFSGNGSQWVGMGKTLLATDVNFRNAVREVDACFKQHAPYSLEAILDGTCAINGVSDEARYTKTEIAQPALFAVQVGIVSMLKQRGIIPVAVAGHSVGEVAAAWASGALSLEAAVKVIFERSRLQGTTHGSGQMTAVTSAALEIEALIDELQLTNNIAISGYNSRLGVTIAGDLLHLETIELALRSRKIAFIRLNLDYAFHSPAMDVIELAIEQSLASIKPSESNVALYSTVTGDIIDGRQLQATYWWHNIRQPVLFHQAVQSMLKNEINVFIEIGPHAVLRSYLKENLAESSIIGKVIPTLIRGQDNANLVWNAASQAILTGCKIDWTALLSWRGRFVQLPNYSWQRERHWLNETSESGGLLSRKPLHPLLGYALAGSTPVLCWQNKLDTKLAPHFKDHIVGGTTVLPGSAFAEIATAIACEFARTQALQIADTDNRNGINGDSGANAGRVAEINRLDVSKIIEIQSLEIRLPLTLSNDHAVVLHSSLDTADGGIKIYSRAYANQANQAGEARQEQNALKNATLHATATLIAAPNTQLCNRDDLFTHFTKQKVRSSEIYGSAADVDPTLNSVFHATFSANSHDTLTGAAGLTYGDAFRAIENGWVCDNTAWARLKIPSQIQDSMSSHHLHPAILDCTFQLILQILQDKTAEHAEAFSSVFIPVRIERFAVNTALKDVPYAATATVHSRSRQSINAEFSIYTATGEVIARFSGVRFQRIRLQKNNIDHLQFLDYRLLPFRHPASNSHSNSAKTSLAQSLVAQFNDSNDAASTWTQSNAIFSDEVEPLLDALSCCYLQEALLLMVNRADGTEEITKINASFDPHNVLPIINLGVAQELLTVSDRGWHLSSVLSVNNAELAHDGASTEVPAQATVSSQAIWSCLANDYPDYFDFTKLIGLIGLEFTSRAEAFAREIQVREAVIDVNHHVKPTDNAAKIFNLSEPSQWWPSMLADGQMSLIAEKISKVVKNKRDTVMQENFSMLEVGGTTWLTEHLCKNQFAFASEYSVILVSDGSNDSFQDGGEKVEQHLSPLIAKHDRLNVQHFAIADVVGLQLSIFERERNIAGAAKFDTANADLALVNIDILSAATAEASLTIARQQLTANGTMLVLIRPPSAWHQFIGGAHQSLSNTFNDTNAGPPLFSIAACERMLKQLGMTVVEKVALTGSSTHGTMLIVATVDATTKTNAQPYQLQSSPASASVIVIVQDDKNNGSPIESAIAAKIAHQGFEVCITDAHTVEALTLFIQSCPSINGQIRQIAAILHLANGSKNVKALPLALATQINRCSIAAAIVKTCQMLSCNAACWMIADSIELNLGDSAYFARSPSTTETTAQSCIEHVGDSLLWGWCRTMMNETSCSNVKLLGVFGLTEVSKRDDSANLTDKAAEAICLEVCEPTEETEVLYDAAFMRFVPRLFVSNSPTPKPICATANYTISAASLAENEPTAKTVKLDFEQPGQLKNLRWETLPSVANAQLDESAIEVNVKATGLNFRDVMFALGVLTDAAMEDGFAGATLGLEFSGVVNRVGTAVKGYRVGDEVLGFGSACFSNRVVTTADSIAHMPVDMSFDAAATIPSTFFTAYYGLIHLARLEAGERVLIHGAAGGVGLAAIQVAQSVGAEIYATAGSSEKRDVLRLLGVSHIYDSRTLTFADDILADTNQIGVDVVLNSLAGEAINRNLRVLKPFGRFIELGKRDFYENTKIGLRPFRNNISYFGVDADQIMRAKPALSKKLFAELMALFSNRTFHPLPYRAFDASRVVDAFRYMQQAKQIGKVIVKYPNGVPAATFDRTASAELNQLRLESNATYLVTGGLSGFGLRTAEWLVSRGARQLVLVNRSGNVSDEASLAITSMRALGASVDARVCDVTDVDAVASLFAYIASDLPPLRAIVHAAMVVEDGLTSAVSHDELSRVLAPKILGAINLHKLTVANKITLDYFILYSSATTLFGNPGQGSYVAANAWLEAFAGKRRHYGLAATVIGWGAIDDVGYLARNTKVKQALQLRMGANAVSSQAALNALENMLLANSSGLGVMELDWRALAKYLPSAQSAKFSVIAKLAGEANFIDANEYDVREMVTTLDALSLKVKFTALIRMIVADILRTLAEKVDVSRSLYEMGLDSLMGVELVSALENRFGVRLPAMVLAENSTIEKLAARLILTLTVDDAHATDNLLEMGKKLSQIQQVALQHGESMSASELTEFANAAAQHPDAPSNIKTRRMIH